MQRNKRETRPADQSNERVHKSNAMVPQPLRLSKGEERLGFAAAIATFAFITWGEAGAAPAIAGAITSAVVLAAIEILSKGEPAR